MYLIIEENPNCEPHERVFSESGPAKIVERLRLDAPDGSRDWLEVTGLEEGGLTIPAKGIQVEDSGAGNAWLIFGGSWGLRFRKLGSKEAWSVSNKSQWGTHFKVLDISGEDILFKSV